MSDNTEQREKIDTRIAPGVENAAQTKPRMHARRVATLSSACVIVIALVVFACFAVAQTNSAGLFTTTAVESATGEQGVESVSSPDSKNADGDENTSVLEESSSEAQDDEVVLSDDTADVQAGAAATGKQEPYSSNSSNESSSSGHAGGSCESHASDTASGGSSENASSGADATGSTDASSNSQENPSQTSSITVSVSVSSDAADSSVSASVRTQFSQGASALDALYATGLSVNVKQTSYGAYVVAIGGLAEKDFGSASGWMYAVNGKVPMTACSKYQLCGGDAVTWYYVA